MYGDQLNHPPNADQVSYNHTANQRRILINDFTSNSEAFEAATERFRVCLPSRPSRASREDTRPQSIFLCLPSRLSSFAMNHSFSYLRGMYMACECLRMQGQRSEPSPAVRFEVLQAQPPTEGQVGFLGQEVSLRCLRPWLRANIEGQFIVG